MHSSHSSSAERLVIQGSGATAFGVAATCVIGGILISICNPLAWPSFAVLCTAGVVFFLFIGAHRRGTTLRIYPDQLVLTAWFYERRVRLSDIDAFSLRTTLANRSLVYSIVCWNASGQEVSEIDTTPFAKHHWREVFTTVQRDRPHLQLDRELQRWLEIA
jgi:hypothetical protein